MSGLIAAVPKGMLKNSVVGAAIALLFYVLLQLLAALLIYCELMREGVLGVSVCISAGISSFLGCGYTVMRGGSGNVLRASTVVLVFLVLTAAVGFVVGESGICAQMLLPVGAAMAAGGLLAAFLPAAGRKHRSGHKVSGAQRRKGR